MKKILLIITLFITSASFAQITIPKYLRGILALPPAAPNTGTFVTCDPVSLSNCNYITNPAFVPSPTYYSNVPAYYPYPFDYDNNENSLIPGWETGTGTPTVWDGVTQWTGYPNPPVNNSNGYFFGAAGMANTLGFYGTESVVQKIPALSPTHTYTLNFYKMYAAFLGYTTDRFRIVLMHCSDYQQTFRTNISGYNFYRVPTLPTHSQVIYCENNVSNGATWEKTFIKFTPNEDYDMMWIYPQEDENDPNKVTGIFVSFPELIDVTNFNAGLPPYATPPNCTVILGPSTPNCYPTGAVFTWYDPQGNPHTNPTNPQQMQVNTSVAANVGTWTLKMTLPGVVTTNNSCSQNITEISATVEVLACGVLPSGPIKIVEIPNVQSAKPADIIRDIDNNSVIGYASIDDIQLPNPEDQEVGFGIVKFDPNGNKIFNRQYKLAGKKLFLKKIHQSYDTAPSDYYLLVGIRDGLTCTCDDQKTLVLKINKNNGDIISSFTIDGFYQNQLHEPFSLGVINNYLYVMSYGHDKTVSPNPSASKIYIVEVNLQNNATRSFYTYDPSSTTSFLKPTNMFEVNWMSPSKSLPIMFFGGLISPDKNFIDNKPFSFYSCENCLLQGAIYNYDNSYVKTANIQQFDGILAVVAQGQNGKLYFTNGNGTQAYFNEKFELLSEKSVGSLGGQGLGGQTYGYASGRYNASESNSTTGYGTILFGNGGDIFYKKFNDLNQNFSLTQADNDIMTSNNSNLFNNEFDMIAYKDPLTFSDKNKFYNYTNLPSSCDLNVNFPSVSANVSITGGLTTILNNMPANILSTNLTTTSELPVNITQICYDAGSFSDNGRKSKAKAFAKPVEKLQSFEVLISPNPVTGNILNLKIEEINKQSLATYSVNITNRIGRVVLQKTNYLQSSPLNVGNLEKGIYYVEIINQKGERVAKSFVKL